MRNAESEQSNQIRNDIFPCPATSNAYEVASSQNRLRMGQEAAPEYEISFYWSVQKILGPSNEREGGIICQCSTLPG